MELPFRPQDDRLLPAGELADIRARLRPLAATHDLATVIACAFDHRTRMLPFIFADIRMAPAGIRAVAAELLDAGFAKTRIVLQQWNKRFRPSKMQLDGRMPDLFCLSTMQLHWSSAQQMLRDVCTIDPDKRPLVIVGGPKAIYEPWDAFSLDPADPWAADLAVTGEAYVLLSLLEVLLAERSPGESLRRAFLRARDRGLLEGIPGLVYARGGQDSVAEELIDTGIQRLCGDLDSQADPVPAFGVLTPPSRADTLSAQPIPGGCVRRYSPLCSLVQTLGCKFGCHYCPIPAYNQRCYRTKSGPRIAEEISRIHQTYGMRNYFGTDDNFFNDHQRTIDICETLANTQIGSKMLRHCARIGSESTVHDAMKLWDYLPMFRKAGLRALWVGVEDLSGALVKKGQTADATTTLFRRLRELGIAPMPMMMHHDNQPLISRGNADGLLNQIRILQKAGAATMQVLMITPSPGSKCYDEMFTSGQVYDSVGRRKIGPSMIDGNYVISSQTRRPWRNQLNLMAAYLMFYNPVRLLFQALDFNTRLKNAYIFLQLFGMYGLAHTIRRTLGYAFRLMACKVKRRSAPPCSPHPMRSVRGNRAAHAVMGTPGPEGDPDPVPAAAVEAS